MSSLTQNLETIYGIKNQIKEAIGTSSDIFADYPAYISAMAGGITPTGYAYVTSNGDYDVSTYAMVNVEVSGGITPSGTYMLDLDPSAGDTPWNYDVTSYAEVSIDFGTQNNINIANNGSYAVSSFGYQFVNGYINVNVPSSGITPSGTITIDDNYNNTTVDVTSYAYADVQVSSGLGFDPYYSQANLFKPISYSGMFDYSTWSQSSPSPWATDYVGVLVDPSGGTYVFSQINVIPLCGTDIPENIPSMDPNDFGLTTVHYWTAYDDAGNQINLYTNDCFLDLGVMDDFAHIQYQNNSGDKQYIRFVSSERIWDSQHGIWDDQHNETEMNAFPVVEYSEINGASTIRNGTYLYLEDGGSIDLYLNYVAGDMGDPDSCTVYAGVTDSNSGLTLWYNIEETPLSGVNFIEYDENNWPPSNS